MTLSRSGEDQLQRVQLRLRGDLEGLMVLCRRADGVFFGGRPGEREKTRETGDGAGPGGSLGHPNGQSHAASQLDASVSPETP